MDSFYTESVIYLIWGGCVQFFCATLAAPVLYLPALWLTDKSFVTLFRAYFVFNVFLWLLGCLGHYVFLLLTYDKLYISVDRMVDWFPYIPFGQWVLDQGFGGESHGHLIGTASLRQLQLIWFAVAVPVWLLAYFSTSFTLRCLACHLPKSESHNNPHPQSS